MDWIEWAHQHLHMAFDEAMMSACSPRIHGVLWAEGLSMLYCMGGEL